MKVFKPELRFLFSFFLSFFLKNKNPERVNKTLEQRQTTMGTNVLDIRRAGRCSQLGRRRRKKNLWKMVVLHTTTRRRRRFRDPLLDDPRARHHPPVYYSCFMWRDRSKRKTGAQHTDQPLRNVFGHELLFFLPNNTKRVRREKKEKKKKNSSPSKKLFRLFSPTCC